MELIIHSPSQEGFIQEISFNNEEIKKELALRLEKYKGLTYTDEEIKVAKTDKATLNKFREAIESKRKEIKNQCLAPYEKFETKIKEITKMIDEPILEIDKQVKSFETKQKEEKKETIIGIYNEAIGDLKEVLPLVKLWNERWLNATYSISNVAKDIVSEVERISADLKSLETIETKFHVEMKNKYLETLLMSEALAIKTRLEEQEKRLEALKKAQEEKATVVVDVPKVQAVQAVEPIVVNAVELPPINGICTPAIEQEIQLEMIDFRVWVSPEQKQSLKKFLIENKIKCGRVGN